MWCAQNQNMTVPHLVRSLVGVLHHYHRHWQVNNSHTELTKIFLKATFSPSHFRNWLRSSCSLAFSPRDFWPFVLDHQNSSKNWLLPTLFSLMMSIFYFLMEAGSLIADDLDSFLEDVDDWTITDSVNFGSRSCSPENFFNTTFTILRRMIQIWGERRGGELSSGNYWPTLNL